MNNYEKLMEEAYIKGLTVKEKPFKSYDGRIKNNKIYIRDSIETTTEKACVLAEEIGHYETNYGDILDQNDMGNKKQERKARIYAYNRRIGLIGIVAAYNSGCKNKHEMAEHLDVTEQFLDEAIKYYRQKYGMFTRVDNYTIYFEPSLIVVENL